jgi:Protein of unknown function (DUF1552)
VSLQDSKTPLLNRRKFLRSSSGFVLTLPFLESLPLRGQESGKRIPAGSKSQTSGPPKRFACIYFSNGVEPEHWWARQTGNGLQLGPGLAPLAPHVQELTFLQGLYNEQAALHASPHLGRMPNLLSGAWVSTNQNEIRVGKSMDQVMADAIGRQTVIPSLVLGIEPMELRLEDGLSMIYGSSISWASDTKPATKEIYPSRVFDLLVGSGPRQLDRSVLDQVLSDAQDLRPKIAVSDRVKLDEYLQSIREIEQRIERAAVDGRLEGWRPTLTAPTMSRPATELPQNVPEHMRLMLDLIVMAFQMDKTRIVTCMLNNDLSQMNFGFLEGVKGSLHLDLTHNGRQPELEAMYLKTNQFHSAQMAYLVERLRAIDEGGRSLLDSSILLFCSNLFDGDKHQATEMPMLLAGRGGGSLSPGRILDYSRNGDADRRACSLYLSLLDRMGVELPGFGDSSQRLANL